MDGNQSEKKSPVDRGNITLPVKDGLLGIRDETVLKFCVEMEMKG